MGLETLGNRKQIFTDFTPSRPSCSSFTKVWVDSLSNEDDHVVESVSPPQAASPIAHSVEEDEFGHLREIEKEVSELAKALFAPSPAATPSRSNGDPMNDATTAYETWRTSVFEKEAEEERVVRKSLLHAPCSADLELKFVVDTLKQASDKNFRLASEFRDMLECEKYEQGLQLLSGENFPNMNESTIGDQELSALSSHSKANTGRKDDSITNDMTRIANRLQKSRSELEELGANLEAFSSPVPARGQREGNSDYQGNIKEHLHALEQLITAAETSAFSEKEIDADAKTPKPTPNAQEFSTSFADVSESSAEDMALWVKAQVQGVRDRIGATKSTYSKTEKNKTYLNEILCDATIEIDRSCFVDQSCVSEDNFEKAVLGLKERLNSYMLKVAKEVEATETDMKSTNFLGDKENVAPSTQIPAEDAIKPLGPHPTSRGRERQPEKHSEDGKSSMRELSKQMKEKEVQLMRVNNDLLFANERNDELQNILQNVSGEKARLQILLDNSRHKISELESKLAATPSLAEEPNGTGDTLGDILANLQSELDTKTGRSSLSTGTQTGIETSAASTQIFLTAVNATTQATVPCEDKVTTVELRASTSASTQTHGTSTLAMGSQTENQEMIDQSAAILSQTSTRGLLEDLPKRNEKPSTIRWSLFQREAKFASSQRDFCAKMTTFSQELSRCKVDLVSESVKISELQAQFKAEAQSVHSLSQRIEGLKSEQ